ISRPPQRTSASRQGNGVMSCRRARDKGARTERAMVRLMLAYALPARKVSAMYKRGEDLRVIVGDVERSVEVKCRAAGFNQLYDWLNERNILILKEIGRASCRERV